jgi:hypothetical protein
MEIFENDLPTTPATPETQDAAGKTNGAQETALPVSSKPNGGKAEPAQNTTHPPAKPNGSAGSTEPQSNPGGSIFDPARWKTPVDARLDPKAPIKPAAFSKIEVRKPPPDHFVHVHPNPDFNGVFPLYADSEKRFDPYLIAPELMDSLPPQVRINVKYYRLAAAIIDTGRLFLWYLAQTGSEWHESGDECILIAMTEWTKVFPDTNGYRHEPPKAQHPEPVFPDLLFAEYLARAFKDRYIDNLQHAVIKRLAGIR